jgi:FkbM family methyltransferase
VPFRIEALADSQKPMELAETREFGVRGEHLGQYGAIKAHFFLRHDGIQYLSPLTDAPTEAVRIQIEAPGQYTLLARWTDPSLARQFAALNFEVAGSRSAALRHWLGSIGRRAGGPGLREWAVGARHEPRALAAVVDLTRPGATVYDIGANIGVFAVRFARRVGALGHVYCFEPNPVCIHLLKTKLKIARADNFDIFPVCVSDRTGMEEFTVNYGNTLLGVGEGSPMADKPGHKIQIERRTLDALIADFNMRPPDVVKIDVEGAESRVVAGMLSALHAHRPILFIELHGQKAGRDTLGLLEHLNYRYRDTSSNRQFANSIELIDWIPDSCVQVLGYP